jgi:serine/threonine-protein kinase
MVPEQAEGRTREVRPATDIYALGSVLLKRLTGRVPFESDSSLELLRRIATTDPVFPADAAPRVPRDLIHQDYGHPRQ